MLTDLLHEVGALTCDVHPDALQVSRRRSRLCQMRYRRDGALLVAAASRQIREITQSGAATYEVLSSRFPLPADAAVLYAALADGVHARWVELEGPPAGGGSPPGIWRPAEAVVSSITTLEDAHLVAEFFEVCLTVLE